MNKKQREAARQRNEARQQSRSVALAQSRFDHAQRATFMKNALARPAAVPGAWAPPAARAILAARAPRLLDARYRTACLRLVELPAVRSIVDWVPRGKSGSTLFRSLAAHLLAKVPVPAIVWNAFHDDHPERLVGLAARVAAGGSLYDYVRSELTVPLTRQMCHDLLATSADYGFVDAIRRVQARAAGVDRRFFEAWRTTRYAQQLGTKDDEAFWLTVLAWFGKVPMLDPGEIGPLCDYLAHRREDDPKFSMKGRSALALLRAMREWHGNLSKEKAIAGKIFAASGFASLRVADQRREDRRVIRELWEINEVLTAKALAEEGRRMGHCVYSYAGRIERGETSIWSVQMEDGHGETGRWHMATVEVRNELRRIVQAKGRFNRVITPKELQIIRRWANGNNLIMSVGSGW